MPGKPNRDSSDSSNIMKRTTNVVPDRGTKLIWNLERLQIEEEQT